MAVADFRCTEKLGVADSHFSDFINVCFHTIVGWLTPTILLC